MNRNCFKIGILLFLLLCGKFVNAQRSIQVVDLDSGKPLQKATISILDFNNKNKVQGETDDNGFFYFSKPIGGVYIEVSFTEFVTTKVVGNDTFRHLVVKLKKQNSILSPTIITAEGKPISSNQSANNVRVITRDKIEKMGVNNLSELLMNEVNMNVNQDNVLGSSVIMQGVSGQNIKILLNGVPIIGRVNGNIDISQVNLNNVLRIEIVEGPMSAIYGSDALGGVLNIITKYPDKKSFSASANTYIDNQQNWNFDGMIERSFSRKFRMNVSGGRYFFTGVDFNPSTRSVDWKPKEKIFGDITTVFYTGKIQHRLRNSVFYEKLIDRSDAEYTPYSITGYNSNFYTSRFDNSLNTIIPLNKSSKIELINSFNYYRRLKTTMVRNLVTGDERIYRTDALDTTSFRLLISRFTLSKSMLSNKLNLLTGYDLNIENGNGKRLSSGENIISDIALFGVLDYQPIEKLKIRPSLRAIHNSKFGNEILGTNFKMAPIIPSLQVKYDLASFLFLRASVARGFRSPTLKEMNFFFVDINHNITGNPDLKAETSENYNVMLDYRNDYGKGHMITMSYSMFHNHIKDKINLALQDAANNRYTYVNIGEFRSQGISFNIDYYMLNWQFTSGLSTIGIRDYTGVDSTSGDYSYYTQARFNISRNFPGIGFQINLLNKYHGTTRGYNADLTTYKTPSYMMSDITFQKSAFKNSTSITFGVKNLLNITSVKSGRRAATIHDSSGGDISISPGRTVFLKISYNFNNLLKKSSQKG